MLDIKNAINLFWMSWLLLVLATNLNAQRPLNLEDIKSKINNHPNVIEKVHHITSSHLNVLQTKFDGGIKLDFSTASNLSIKSNVNPLNNRAINTRNDYLDGVLTLDTPLYDFGKLNALVNSLKQEEKISKLMYVEAFEETIFKLLSLSIDYVNMSKLERMLVMTKATLVERIKILRTQFIAGVGTLSDVRETQIFKIDLEIEIDSIRLKKYELGQTLEKEFFIKQTQIKEIASFGKDIDRKSDKQGLNNLIRQSENPKIEINRTNEIFLYHIKLINYEISSIKASQKPQITSKIKAIAYDLNGGLNEYNVYAAINIAIPLFDSGSSAVKMKISQHNLTIQKDKLISTKIEKQSKLDNLIFQNKNLKNKYKSGKYKEVRLNDKLKNIHLRSITDGGVMVLLVKTQLQRDQLQRELQNYKVDLIKNNLDYLLLSENLLHTVNLNTVVRDAYK